MHFARTVMTSWQSPNSQACGRLPLTQQLAPRSSGSERVGAPVCLAPSESGHMHPAGGEEPDGFFVIRQRPTSENFGYQ